MGSMIFGAQPPLVGQAGGATAPSGRRRARLLIVGDEAAVLRFMRTVLTKDYELAVASDGQEGLRAAIASPPDLILSDLDMPRMTGEELLRALRPQPSLRDVPFIVLMAVGDQQLKIDLLRAGAQDFLVKPFSTEEVKVRVANHVRMKIARDLLQEELESRSSDLALLIGEVAERRAGLQIAQELAQQASRAKSEFPDAGGIEARDPEPRTAEPVLSPTP